MWGGIFNRINMLVAEKEHESNQTVTHLHLDQTNRAKTQKFSIFGDGMTTNSDYLNTISCPRTPDQKGETTQLRSNVKAFQMNAQVIRSSPNSKEHNSILTENQIRRIDLELYTKLNDPRYEIQEKPEQQIFVNADLLVQNMQVIGELTHIIFSQDKGSKQADLNTTEINDFISVKEFNVISGLFKRKEKELDKTLVLKNKYEIENELFQLKALADRLLLQDKDQKIVKIQRYFGVVYANLDQAHEALNKLRKQRYCLMEIKKNGLEITSIRKKLNKKKRLEDLISMYTKLQERFKKMTLMMAQKFSCDKACNIYNNLLVALIYCQSKILSGVDLTMLKIYKQKLEDKLIYTKHKLNQNFYFELRMFKNCKEKYSHQNLSELVRQLMLIEEVAKSFIANPNIKGKEIAEILKKDEYLLRSRFQENSDDFEFFNDSEVKTLVISLYKQFMSDGSKKGHPNREKNQGF